MVEKELRVTLEDIVEEADEAADDEESLETEYEGKEFIDRESPQAKHRIQINSWWGLIMAAELGGRGGGGMNLVTEFENFSHQMIIHGA